MTEENIFEMEMKENYPLHVDVGETSKWGPEYEKKVINLSKRVFYYAHCASAPGDSSGHYIAPFNYWKHSYHSKDH